jgi:hypothetical protein
VPIGLRWVGDASILETFAFDFSRFCAAGIELSAESPVCFYAWNPSVIKAHANHNLGMICHK